MAAIEPIPEGYPHVIPSLVVDGAAAAIDFYTQVLGATERMRMEEPDGKVGHAELAVGDGVIMLADPYPEMGYSPPAAGAATSIVINVYVDDVDAVFARALAAGATELRPVTDQFYGDRSGQFRDPWGHVWTVATHIEDVSEEEMARRMAELSGSG